MLGKLKELFGRRKWFGRIGGVVLASGREISKGLVLLGRELEGKLKLDGAGALGNVNGLLGAFEFVEK